MSDFLVLDIETVPDEELPIPQPAEPERIPSPPHHRIVALGALRFDEKYEVERIGLIGDGKDEGGVLSDFARVLGAQRPWLITFNGRGFDLPVIVSRCLRHGVSLAPYYRGRDYRYRYSAEGHLDLMDFVADFGAAKASKLDVMARLCGMPGKIGVSGADVAGMVAAGQLTDVQTYCLCDVAQTAAVFLRVQLLRGELNRTEYLAAMAGLIDCIRTDARLAAVSGGLNENRLLLREAAAP